MIDISIHGSTAVFEVEGLNKLWALKSRLEIPLANIRSVRVDPEAARGWWKGIRAPGTHVPGVIAAGTFYRSGKRIFWGVRDPDQTIVVDLEDEDYDALIVQVDDPAGAVEVLEAGRRAVSAGE